MAAKSSEIVEIQPIKLVTIPITIVGDTQLIIHAWDTKVKQQMLDKHMGKATKAREKKRPYNDCIESLYWLENKPKITDDMSDEDCAKLFYEAVASGARFGFPATGLKQAAVSAAYRSKLSKDKVSLYAAFYIEGEYIEIKGSPDIREDMVTVNSGTPDIRFRGCFDKWESTFNVTFNAGAISAEQVINIINYGGFACGIGEWRTEKGGDKGRFHVKSKGE